jgi:hypothetical protein
MYKTIYLFLNVLFTLPAFCQSFEGKIVYKISYQSHQTGLLEQSLKQRMGDTSTYYIKEAHTRTEGNGISYEWQVYVPALNKLFTKTPESEILVTYDASKNSDEVLKAELTKNTITILGYKCNELVLTCKTGVQKYYFSSKLPIDRNLFRNYQFGNWHEYLTKSGAIPLKYIIQNNLFTMESTAVAVQQMKLDLKVFTLETGVQTMASPYQ